MDHNEVFIKLAEFVYRNKVLSKLAKYRIRLVHQVLLSAVEKESKIDPNIERYKEFLKNFMRGISIIYYFAFLESHVSESQWKSIKSPKGMQRKNF